MSLNPATIIPSSPPPGLNFLAAIRPSLNMLLIGTAWSSALVPLFFAMFLFSTKQLRRTPIFILNVISIMMGLCLGILNYYIEVTAIISPQFPVSQSCFIAFGVLICLVPLFVESILVVRVLAVYPVRVISRSMAVIVYLPLICFKLARLINFALFWHVWFPLLALGGNPIILSQEAWNRPYQKIEWFLQVFDTGYSSALFLWRLRAGRSTTGRVESNGRRSSYPSLLNSLFWIAISNFVFPVMLSFAQLIFAFQDSSYLHGSYVLLTNTYVEIIGVLLATVWSSGSKWSVGQQEILGRASTTLSAPRFAPPTAVSVTQFSENDTKYKVQSDSEGVEQKNQEIKLGVVGDKIDGGMKFAPGLP